jgi:hypothetical protein
MIIELSAGLAAKAGAEIRNLHTSTFQTKHAVLLKDLKDVKG